MRGSPLHLASRMLLPALLFLAAASPEVRAEAPPFDLAGPRIDMHVQRDDRTLPIAEVPNLLPGDRLWIHPDLPSSQSAHYILVVAFLRGATNPPPDGWFRRVETWDRKVQQEGVFVVVPAEAQQALIFLAPETIGDFSTLRNAVRGRPGTFVRATQDLQQASWDRMRLNAYLDEVNRAMRLDPERLKDRTALTARSLGVRLEQQCFDKPTEQQAPCLTQNTEGMVLDDANTQSLVTQLANGSTADLMNQLSYAPMAGAGLYSPYVGALVDLTRILSSLHTAKYQYIPALALPQKDRQQTLNLRLNVAPSFRDPKSVIVVALPPVAPAVLPQPHPPDLAQNPAQGLCVDKPGLTLAVDDAPLLYATALGHDLTLHLDTKLKLAETPASRPELPLPSADGAGSSASAVAVAGAGSPSKTAPAAGMPAGIDVPIHADPALGGFLLDRPLPQLPEAEVSGEIRGEWGFDRFQGPQLHFHAAHAGNWAVAAEDRNVLITGRDDTVHIQGDSTECVAEVHAAIPGPHEADPPKLNWKSHKPNELEVSVPLKEATPGTVTFSIRQYGLDKPEQLKLKAYSEAASMDSLTMSAGDDHALLKGRRLDEVESAELAGIRFAPAARNRVGDSDQLEMTASVSTTQLQPGGSYSAVVTLRDGRSIHVSAAVGAERPQIQILSRSVQADDVAGDLAGAMTGPTASMTNGAAAGAAGGAANAGAQQEVRLGPSSNPNDLPVDHKLVVFLKSRVPAVFSRSEKIEVAGADSSGGNFTTTLSFADGSLVLEDAHTAVATIDPVARFGLSAFGPIQLRAVTDTGVTGDWAPLGSLVRLPGLKQLRCPRPVTKPCQLLGSNMFLVTAVGTSADMANSVDVAPQFAGDTVMLANLSRSGNSATVYLRLRDDPSAVQAMTIPVTIVAGIGWGPADAEKGAAVQDSNSTSSSGAGVVIGSSVAGTSAAGSRGADPAQP